MTTPTTFQPSVRYSRTSPLRSKGACTTGTSRSVFVERCATPNTHLAGALVLSTATRLARPCLMQSLASLLNQKEDQGKSCQWISPPPPKGAIEQKTRQ